MLLYVLAGTNPMRFATAALVFTACVSRSTDPALLMRTSQSAQPAKLVKEAARRAAAERARSPARSSSTNALQSSRPSSARGASSRPFGADRCRPSSARPAPQSACATAKQSCCIGGGVRTSIEAMERSRTVLSMKPLERTASVCPTAHIDPLCSLNQVARLQGSCVSSSGHFTSKKAS